MILARSPAVGVVPVVMVMVPELSVPLMLTVALIPRAPNTWLAGVFPAVIICPPTVISPWKLALPVTTRSTRVALPETFSEPAFMAPLMVAALAVNKPFTVSEPPITEEPVILSEPNVARPETFKLSKLAEPACRLLLSLCLSK